MPPAASTRRCASGRSTRPINDGGPMQPDRIEDEPVLAILRDLRVAVSQLRLFPKDSPQALRALNDTFPALNSYLEEHGYLTLARAAGDLVVNGRPLAPAGAPAVSNRDAVLALMSDAQVRSITLKKGLAVEELVGFLHAMTRRFWDLRDGKEINRRLREEGILQVSVDEVQYVALGEGDIVIEDAARKLAAGGTVLADLIARLDKAVDAAAREGLGAEGRLHVMKRLLEIDPSLLEKAGGERRATGPSEDEGLLGFQQAREIIEELSDLLGEVPPPLRDRIRRAGAMVADAFGRHAPLKQSLMRLLEERAAV